MTTLGLVDTPRCLSITDVYVGAPRTVTEPGRDSMWSRATPWVGTLGYRAQAVKECLDTLAVLRAYREPAENETWLIPAGSERRLLAQVNAIIALGPDALSQVIDMALDPDVPDPGRVFAALFAIGCVQHREWLERASNVFVSAVVRNAGEAAAAIEALCLAPNPAISSLLVPFLADDRPRVRSAAIRILGFRRELPEIEWFRAVRDSENGIVAAALSAPLREYDEATSERALEALLARVESESLVQLALCAGLSRSFATVHAVALQIAKRDPAWADAAHCVAMFGHLRDARHIREMLDGAALPHGIRAAATLGSVDLVPDLLELLHREGLPAGIAAQAARALTRITGLPFVEGIDASQALGLWSEHRDSFDHGVRHRAGRPLTPEVLLASLRVGQGSRGARQTIYLELLAGTGGNAPHFSPYDFVRPQVESLQRIDDWLSTSRP
jgi:hypothetical protein